MANAQPPAVRFQLRTPQRTRAEMENVADPAHSQPASRSKRLLLIPLRPAADDDGPRLLCRLRTYIRLHSALGPQIAGFASIPNMPVVVVVNGC